jgi:hypothetical protein
MTIREQPPFTAALRAKTRPGIFWRCVVTGLASWVALHLSPWISTLLVIAACAFFFRHSTAIIATLGIAALLPQASLNLFGNHVDQPYVETTLVLSALVHALALFSRKQWTAGRHLSLLFVCGAIGGILTLSTTQDTATTLRSLLQFLVPIFILLAWLDNLLRRATHAHEAPYALAGVLAAFLLATIVTLMTGRAYTYTSADLNGVVWQPQIVGLCLAPLIVLLVRLRRLPVWLRMLGVGAATWLVWLAWSRTGLAALTVIAVLEGLRLVRERVSGPAAKQSPSTQRNSKKLEQIGLALVYVAALVGSLWFASSTPPSTPPPGATKQIFSVEGYASSRSFPLKRSFSNIEDHLGTGLGFGIPSDSRLIDPDTAYENLRVLKTESRFVILIDKGNSFVAIVEETGILGAPIWLFLFFIILASVASTGPVGLSMALLFILCAIGEATVFTLSGIGLLQWTALIAAAGFARQPRRRLSRTIQRYDSHEHNGLNRRIDDAK